MSGFGITRAQIASIAATWAAHGRTLTVEYPPDPGGPPSRTVAAVASFAERTRAVTAGEGTRLTSLAAALRRFDAITDESDQRSAVLLGHAGRTGSR